jgi:hypothetical protein
VYERKWSPGKFYADDPLMEKPSCPQVRDHTLGKIELVQYLSDIFMNSKAYPDHMPHHVYIMWWVIQLMPLTNLLRIRDVSKLARSTARSV